MSRLYEISYNKNQWEVQGNRNTRYTLVNKKTLESYCIPGDVIGIEQITDDEFLVYRIIFRDEYEPGDRYQIAQIKLKNSIINFMYCHDFYNRFGFLTKDTIIFYNDGLLYSISKNEECNSLNHLFSENDLFYDHRLFVSRTICPILCDGKDYPDYLLIEYELPSGYLKIGAYLQVLVDVNSLLPIMPVYSTLRPGKLYLEPSQTLGQLIEKETHYSYIVGDFLYDLYTADNRKKPNEILDILKETN